MNPDEYANLARLEREHWFYSGKREIVRHWIRRVRPLVPEDLLADCGAGTGTVQQTFGSPGVASSISAAEADIIHIDITVIKDDYHGDTSRMFVVGEASIQAKRLIHSSALSGESVETSTR